MGRKIGSKESIGVGLCQKAEVETVSIPWILQNQIRLPVTRHFVRQVRHTYSLKTDSWVKRRDPQPA